MQVTPDIERDVERHPSLAILGRIAVRDAPAQRNVLPRGWTLRLMAGPRSLHADDRDRGTAAGIVPGMCYGNVRSAVFFGVLASISRVTGHRSPSLISFCRRGQWLVSAPIFLSCVLRLARGVQLHIP